MDRHAWDTLAMIARLHPACNRLYSSDTDEAVQPPAPFRKQRPDTCAPPSIPSQSFNDKSSHAAVVSGVAEAGHRRSPAAMARVPPPHSERHSRTHENGAETIQIFQTGYAYSPGRSAWEGSN